MRSFQWILLLLVAALAFVGCDDGSEEGEEDAGIDLSQEVGEEDTSSESWPLTGETRSYRFSVLELTEPDVSARIVLNSLIQANMGGDPTADLAVNVVLQFRAWDLDASPTMLEVAGSAGIPHANGDEYDFSFREDTQPAFVPAHVEQEEGAHKIYNDEPTDLLFPVRISTDEFFVPFRDLQLDICYGEKAKCDGGDEGAISGWLEGGIIEAEADEVMVEFQPGDTMLFGDILRDPKGECSTEADCSGGRGCHQGECVRKPDMTINGQDAFSMRGRFIGLEVGFVE